MFLLSKFLLLTFYRFAVVQGYQFCFVSFGAISAEASKDLLGFRNPGKFRSCRMDSGSIGSAARTSTRTTLRAAFGMIPLGAQMHPRDAKAPEAPDGAATEQFPRDQKEHFWNMPSTAVVHEICVSHCGGRRCKADSSLSGDPGRAPPRTEVLFA